MPSTVTSKSINSILIGLLKLIRPKQWIKNGFVLIPLAFSGAFTNPANIIDSLQALILFCIASSATYIVNDYHDINDDINHPTKSLNRPLASGQVSKQYALLLLALLYAILFAGYFFKPQVILVISAYLLLNIAYTFYFKHQPVLDIFIIASGFVLRVYAGATALTVPLSSWMFITTLCLALYLAAIKRRQELITNGNSSRKVLEHYTVPLINRYAEMSATGALLFYSLFVITSRPELVVTIPFVIYGIFRYWFVVESNKDGESPTDILISDWQLSLTIFIWISICIWTLWPLGA